MAKLNANQIALVIFMGWYVMEDSILNPLHRLKLGGIIDDILDYHGIEGIEHITFDSDLDIPKLDGLPDKMRWEIIGAYMKIVTDRVKEGNLPDDLERLMIRLTTMDLKLITEETILSTVKAWNYGN